MKTTQNSIIQLQDLIFHSKGSHPRWN